MLAHFKALRELKSFWMFISSRSRETVLKKFYYQDWQKKYPRNLGHIKRKNLSQINDKERNIHNIKNSLPSFVP